MGVTTPESYATGGNFVRVQLRYPNTFSATLTFGPGPVSRGFVLHYTRVPLPPRDAVTQQEFHGDQGSMIPDRAGYSIIGEVRGGKITSTGAFNAEQTVMAEDDHLYHFELWLKNLRDRKQPEANPETCHRATAVGHLMNISWVRPKIRWDGQR
jgi:hypothetical protein